MKTQLTFAAVLGAAAALLLSPYAAAAAEHTHPRPVLTHVETVAAFDFAAGEAPENITVNPDGALTVSMLGSVAGKRPELVRITASGQRTVLVVGQQGDAITGNARDSDGDIFYNVWSADASRAGVWKLPRGAGPRRIAALPVNALPNGLALDPARHTLYVSDSFESTVWAVAESGGPATAWLTDPALAPVPSTSLGANGLRYHNGAVWVSNLSQGTLLRIPVTAAAAPGRIRVVTSSLTGADDFNFVSDRSDVVFAAQNGPNKIAVVCPNGTTTTVLTASEGLASPTATAVRGNRLYITDAGLNAPHDSELQSATIDPAALPCGPTR